MAKDIGTEEVGCRIDAPQPSNRGSSHRVQLPQSQGGDVLSSMPTGHGENLPWPSLTPL